MQPPQTSATISVDPRNRLNDLDSRSWLKFQKSWFVLPAAKSLTKSAAEFILFFTKKNPAAGGRARVGLLRENAGMLSPLVKRLGREAVVFKAAAAASAQTAAKQLDYVLIDLCHLLAGEQHSLENIAAGLQAVQQLASRLKPNAYLTIFARNFEAQGRLLPWAWHFGLAVSRFLVIKDERIGCSSASGALNLIRADGELTRAERSESTALRAEQHKKRHAPEGWKTRQDVIYCLNFRREENEGENSVHSVFPLSKPFFLTPSTPPPSLPKSKTSSGKMQPRGKEIAPRTRLAQPAALPPSWFVAKPPPREKNVLLHPAKFPESLVTYFLREFSREGERVFDPMAGTGSTLLAALAEQRHACGIELNPQFHGIAVARLQKYCQEHAAAKKLSWRLACGDAALVKSYRTLPQTFDYVLTSPPYWDMLRMKGAETQQKRQQAGLLQFYSNDARDLGNREDYAVFLADLVKIYLRVAARLAAGRYMTIVVKNVKKRGRIYPLAWDLALRLSDHLILCHEQFWCQDDQRLAPFGYRYAWVSNTFHHYCLHFRKP